MSTSAAGLGSAAAFALAAGSVALTDGPVFALAGASVFAFADRPPVALRPGEDRTARSGAGAAGTASARDASSSSKSKLVTVCGLPSSDTEKSSRVRPRTTAPVRSRTTTLTSTSSVPGERKHRGRLPGRLRCGRHRQEHRRQKKQQRTQRSRTPPFFPRRLHHRSSEPKPGAQLDPTHRPHRGDLTERRRIHDRVDGRQTAAVLKTLLASSWIDKARL